jgi:uncharacterized repeat protein (TIGR01451 family)
MLAAVAPLMSVCLLAPLPAGAMTTPAPGDPATSAVSTGTSFTLTPADTASIGLVALPPLEPSFASAGVVLHFRYTVTNTGAVPLTDVTPRDSLSGISSVSWAATTLAPGASTECVAAYTTTQADVTAGGVTNIATVTGQPPTGSVVESDPVSVTIPARSGPPGPSFVFVPVPIPVGGDTDAAGGDPGAGAAGAGAGAGGIGFGAVAVAPAGTSPLGSQPVPVTG